MIMWALVSLNCASPELEDFNLISFTVKFLCEPYWIEVCQWCISCVLTSNMFNVLMMKQCLAVACSELKQNASEDITVGEIQ